MGENLWYSRTRGAQIPKPEFQPKSKRENMTIDHLILNVNDLDASVDFYVNILGFKNEGPYERSKQAPD